MVTCRFCEVRPCGELSLGPQQRPSAQATEDVGKLLWFLSFLCRTSELETKMDGTGTADPEQWKRPSERLMRLHRHGHPCCCFSSSPCPPTVPTTLAIMLQVSSQGKKAGHHLSGAVL